MNLLVAIATAGSSTTSTVEVASAFNDRRALLLARDAMCNDPVAAAVVYGPISSWDVSNVTDLSFMFCAAHGSCFTGDIHDGQVHVPCETGT